MTLDERTKDQIAGLIPKELCFEFFTIKCGTGGDIEAKPKWTSAGIEVSLPEARGLLVSTIRASFNNPKFFGTVWEFHPLGGDSIEIARRKLIPDKRVDKLLCPYHGWTDWNEEDDETDCIAVMNLEALERRIGTAELRVEYMSGGFGYVVLADWHTANSEMTLKVLDPVVLTQFETARRIVDLGEKYIVRAGELHIRKLTELYRQQKKMEAAFNAERERRHQEQENRWRRYLEETQHATRALRLPSDFALATRKWNGHDQKDSPGAVSIMRYAWFALVIIMVFAVLAVLQAKGVL